MELDKLQITLRRRTAWEAIDLGFAMARRWFFPLWLLWLSTAAPVALILFLLFNDSLWAMGLLLWWLKPLYEPTLMFWLSRAVFSEAMPVKSVMSQWWQITRPQILINLTLRRFNPSRSFTMPVALLEQLSGKPRRMRLRILGRDQHASAWLTIVGIHLEVILQIGLIALLFILIPDGLRWISLDELLMGEGPLGEWLQLLGSLLCMSLIAPFYVAAGFALYLHRRSELEGWDLEIAFRRINERYLQHNTAPGSRRRGVSALLLSLMLLGSVNSMDAEAAPAAAERSRTVIADVLADDDFGHYEQEGYWKYTGEKAGIDDDDSGVWELLEPLFKVIRGFLEGYAAVGKVIMWGGGIAIVAYLLYRIAISQGWLSGNARLKKPQHRAAPVALFGLDLNPDSLPDNPAAEAMRLVEQGERRAALSLLYRASLLALISDHQLDIPASATENECVELVRCSRGSQETDFFARLTRDWIQLAYGHHQPQPGQLLTLCQEWQEIYGHVEH